MLPDDHCIAQEIKQLNEDVLPTFAEHAPLPDSATHFEVFRLPTGELKFLEIAARAPGALTKETYLAACGVNMEYCHYHLAIGLEVDAVSKNSQFSTYMMFPKKSGIVTKVYMPDLLGLDVLMEDCLVNVGKSAMVFSGCSHCQDKSAYTLLARHDDFKVLEQSFQRLKVHQVVDTQILAGGLSGRNEMAINDSQYEQKPALTLST